MDEAFKESAENGFGLWTCKVSTGRHQYWVVQQQEQRPLAVVRAALKAHSQGSQKLREPVF